MDSASLLHRAQVIAVVGLSDKPERPSYQVATYLQQHGYTIIPVNPMIASVLGVSAYPSITSIPLSQPIDVVDIFRKPEDAVHIVEEVIQTGRQPAIWMQEGVVSQDAKQLAEAHGLEVVMDMCMMKTHQVL